MYQEASAASKQVTPSHYSTFEHIIAKVHDCWTFQCGSGRECKSPMALLNKIKALNHRGLESAANAGLAFHCISVQPNNPAPAAPTPLLCAVLITKASEARARAARTAPVRGRPRFVPDTAFAADNGAHRALLHHSVPEIDRSTMSAHVARFGWSFASCGLRCQARRQKRGGMLDRFRHT